MERAIVIEHLFDYPPSMAIALPRAHDGPRQTSFAELGTPLFSTTFVVLDIETTGGSPDGDRITEVGALKVRGGETIGTFQTLVRPEESIPASIELLTGISDLMVATAPPIEEVLPSLWEFLRGAVLVAHNARFDAGFLAAAFARHGYEVPFKRNVCTLRLARWLMKGETTDMRLETLAARVGTAARPCHRAFADAAATMEVFHRLLEVAGPMGVLTLEDLIAFTRVGRKPDPGKAGLAARVPRVAGVYKFIDRNGKVLYVGKAKNLRARVRSYFYGDERAKVRDLVREVAKIDVERTSSELAAEIRELHLIRLHDPRYNRRGRRRGRSAAWIKLAPGPIPRLVVARTAPKEGHVLGPFPSQRAARDALDAIRDAYPVPRCSDPRKHPNGCAFGQMGRCIAPCHADRRESHQQIVATMVSELSGRGIEAITRLTARMESLAEDLRYEDAAQVRDRIATLEHYLAQEQMVRCLSDAGDLVVAAPSSEGYEVVALRRGRFVASVVVDSPDACDTASLFISAPDEVDIASHEHREEAQIVWRWLTKAARRGAFVLHCTGSLHSHRH